jgi:nucleotide-binding universal stress UspA family protein
MLREIRWASSAEPQRSVKGIAADMAFKRILIAVDTSEIGTHATLVGLELASALGAEVAFIHVIGPAISDGAWFPVASAELTEAPDAEISQVLASLQGRVPISIEAVKFVPVGSPIEAITEAARSWPADLVVIGSHGRDGVDRVLLGSVAEGVARHAPCPVLVVRK